MTVAVTNNPASALAGRRSSRVDIQAGLERAVAATKTYTAELLALYLLLIPLAGTAPTGQPALADLVDRLAEAAAATLASRAAVAAAAARYRFADRLITTARGFGYPTAREAALKLMETCYLGAQAFSGADLLHGPMAMVDADLPVLAISTPGAGGRAMLAVLERLRERRCRSGAGRRSPDCEPAAAAAACCRWSPTACPRSCSRSWRSCRCSSWPASWRCSAAAIRTRRADCRR